MNRQQELHPQDEEEGVAVREVGSANTSEHGAGAVQVVPQNFASAFSWKAKNQKRRKMKKKPQLVPRSILGDNLVPTQIGTQSLSLNWDRMVCNRTLPNKPVCSFEAIGEPIVEPEVDLSNFMERQRITDEKDASLGVEPVGQQEDEDDVDHALDHITAGVKSNRQQIAPKKGKVQTLEWDEELESMAREKAAAEATRGSF